MKIKSASKITKKEYQTSKINVACAEFNGRNPSKKDLITISLYNSK